MVKCACLLSAFCFIISNSLSIAVIVRNLTRDSFSKSSWRALNPEYLVQEWDYRRSTGPLLQTCSIFNAFGWLFFTFPIFELTWVLSHGGKRKAGLHAAIAAFTITGCFSEVMSRLILLGAWGSAHWISTKFNLNYWLPDGSEDQIGWKSLEATWIIAESLVTWIDAFEWICLFFVLVLLYFSIGTLSKEKRVLPLWWARLGLLIALFAFIDFSADLVNLEDFDTFARISILCTILNTLILLPCWLIFLSCHFHDAFSQIVGAKHETIQLELPVI